MSKIFEKTVSATLHLSGRSTAAFRSASYEHLAHGKVVFLFAGALVAPQDEGEEDQKEEKAGQQGARSRCTAHTAPDRARSQRRGVNESCGEST